MKKKKPLKKSKLIYLQGWGSYTNETLVAVGVSYKEIIAYAKKNKFDSGHIAKLESDNERKDFQRLINHGAKGMFWVNEGASFLWIQTFADTWDFYEILVHELTHAIDRILGEKGMGKEMEARAYQMEFLFRSIRKKIQFKLK